MTMNNDENKKQKKLLISVPTESWIKLRTAARRRGMLFHSFASRLMCDFADRMDMPAEKGAGK